jgi:hypothetical protein
MPPRFLAPIDCLKILAQDLLICWIKFEETRAKVLWDPNLKRKVLRWDLKKQISQFSKMTFDILYLFLILWLRLSHLSQLKTTITTISGSCCVTGKVYKCKGQKGIFVLDSWNIVEYFGKAPLANKIQPWGMVCIWGAVDLFCCKQEILRPMPIRNHMENDRYCQNYKFAFYKCVIMLRFLRTFIQVCKSANLTPK